MSSDLVVVQCLAGPLANHDEGVLGLLTWGCERCARFDTVNGNRPALRARTTRRCLRIDMFTAGKETMSVELEAKRSCFGSPLFGSPCLTHHLFEIDLSFFPVFTTIHVFLSDISIVSTFCCCLCGAHLKSRGLY